MNAHQRSPVRPIPESELLRIVETIRALVVGRHVVARTAVTASRSKADRALASIRAAAAKALRITYIPSAISLDSLPSSALNSTCANLAVDDVLALSRTNRRLRSQALAYLANLNAVEVPYTSASGWVQTSRNALGRRTVSARLFDLESASDIGKALDTLADSLVDAYRLSVEVDWSPATERGLLRALSEPASQLQSFSLTSYIYNIHDMRHHTLLDLDGQHLLFANIAPSLTKCSLNGVRLPPASSAAFRAVTCFKYSLVKVMEVADISRILALMPSLRTLALMASGFQAVTGDIPLVTHSTLRNILLSTWDQCNALPWLPQFHFADNISLVGTTVFALKSLPYHVPHGACVQHVDALVFSRHKALDLETCIRLHHGHVGDPNAVLFQVSAYPLTWLSIGELVWPDGETIMPAMNTLETLAVTFAPCFLIGPYSPYVGLFAAAYTTPGAPDTRWAMPRLRELRISRPPLSQDSPHLTQDWQTCRCGSFTVSLHDVSSFIRHCVSFSAPKLDAVVVAGATVVDYDFAAAWSDLVRFTEGVDIEEGCDTKYARRIPTTPSLTGADFENYFSLT